MKLRSSYICFLPEHWRCVSGDVHEEPNELYNQDNKNSCWLEYLFLAPSGDQGVTISVDLNLSRDLNLHDSGLGLSQLRSLSGLSLRSF